MRRSAFSILILASSSFLVLAALSGCGGSGVSGPGAPSKIVVSPSPVSLNVGQTQGLSAVVQDASGNSISGQTFQFNTSDSTKVTTSNGGFLCAGQWDGSFIHCTPTANPTGTATITVKASPSGLSQDVTVYVHQKADSVIVAKVGDPLTCNTVPGPATSCVSVGATAPANTASYTAIACSSDPNICGAGNTPCQLPSDTLGQFVFSSSNPSVVTLAADTTNPNTVTVATAKTPGLAQILASLSGTSSLPANFQTCAPQSIFAHVQNQATQTTLTIATGATGTLVADVLDTNGIAIPNPTLNWVSTSPGAVTVSGSGGVTGAAAGNSNIIAGCAPPGCNTDSTQAIYSNPVNVTVTGTAKTTTVYVTSTDAGTTNLIPIDTSTNTAGTAIALPNTLAVPNSMQFTGNGGKLFIGTDTGVAAFDPGAGTFATTTLAKGRVIGTSNTTSAVVVADTTPNVNNVYTWVAGASAVATYSIAGAKAAVFTPDGNRLFVVASGAFGERVYEIANSVFMNEVASGAPSDVTMLPNGSFAFVADPGMQFYSSCFNTLSGNVGISPVLVGAAGKPVPAPNNQQMQVIAVVPPQIEQVDVLPTAAPAGTSCPLAPTTTANAYTFPLVPAFTPAQLVISPDNSRAMVLASDVNQVLVYTIGTDAFSGSTTSIQLSGAATGSYQGGITTDGGSAYVGVIGANEVQQINLSTGAVSKQISVSLSPKLVAVKP